MKTTAETCHCLCRTTHTHTHIRPSHCTWRMEDTRYTKKNRLKYFFHHFSCVFVESVCLFMMIPQLVKQRYIFHHPKTLNDKWDIVTVFCLRPLYSIQLLLHDRIDVEILFSPSLRHSFSACVWVWMCFALFCQSAKSETKWPFWNLALGVKCYEISTNCQHNCKFVGWQSVMEYTRCLPSIELFVMNFKQQQQKSCVTHFVYQHSKNVDLKSHRNAGLYASKAHNSKSSGIFIFHQFNMYVFIFLVLGFLVFRSLDVETYSHRCSHSITIPFVRSLVRRSLYAEL